MGNKFGDIDHEMIRTQEAWRDYSASEKPEITEIESEIYARKKNKHQNETDINPTPKARTSYFADQFQDKELKEEGGPLFASPSLPDLQIPADTACGEAKHSLPPSGGHSAVSQPILDADKQTYQHDLSQSSRIKTDMNQTKTSNNEITEREREIFGDTSTLDLDQCDVTEDPVIECLDNVLDMGIASMSSSMPSSMISSNSMVLSFANEMDSSGFFSDMDGRTSTVNDGDEYSLSNKTQISPITENSEPESHSEAGSQYDQKSSLQFKS